MQSRREQQIGLWSPNYAQTTGQALVTRHVAEQVLPKIGKVRLYVFRPSGRPAAIWSWLSNSARLWQDHWRARLDLVYVVCSRSTAGFLRDLPVLCLSRMGLRVVVHAHGSDIVTLFQARSVAPVARWAYKRCEVVVPSAHLVVELSKTPLAAVHVCENFFQAGAVDSQCDGPPDRLAVLWNSNIMGSKGAFDLFEAVRRLEDRGVAVDLRAMGRIIGDHEYSKSKAELHLSQAIADGTVDFLGALSASEAREQVYQADVVALPSRYSSELQPLALIEAMCAGRAIVASDTPALRATLGDYPAEFVAAHSIDEIVVALERLGQEKSKTPEVFFFRHETPAKTARVRFSSVRFDERLCAILDVASGGTTS